MMQPGADSKKHISFTGALGVVLLATVVAGTLDLLMAFAIHGYLLGNTPPGRVLQFIASGVFGNAAYTGGAAMAYRGLGFHYLITFLFAAAFFLAYMRFVFFRKRFMLSGLFYGVLVWTIMNWVVLPLSSAPVGAPAIPALIAGLATVILCVGLPIALIVHQFQKTRQNRNLPLS